MKTGKHRRKTLGEIIRFIRKCSCERCQKEADQVEKQFFGPEAVNMYCEKYDAYYDKHTQEWTEAECGQESCRFCRLRPSKHGTGCPCLKQTDQEVLNGWQEIKEAAKEGG